MPEMHFVDNKAVIAWNTKIKNAYAEKNIWPVNNFDGYLSGKQKMLR